MRVLAAIHPTYFLHESPGLHPERPERLRAVQRGLELSPAEILTLEAPVVDPAVLRRIHTPEYVDAVEQFCATGGGDLDPDTYAVAESWTAALHAAGAGPAVASALENGAADAAFCAVRPPGHHATENRAMGFCLFNNIAITARALTDGGARVAIVDWDVHHGNGTQDLFIADGDVLYLSLHQFPFYPGTGWLDETGYGAGLHRTINVPVPAGTAGDVYREAFRRIVSPVVRQFAPDWLLVSAGYDGHRDDPLAELNLLASDYAFMANSLVDVVPSGRTILFLEGGYDLVAIRDSVVATIAGLAGELDFSSLPFEDSPESAWRSLELAERTVAEAWEVR